eukprot:SM000040S14866  [mRNA]  locus=s40:691863:693487:- [translate_table: standard]
MQLRHASDRIAAKGHAAGAPWPASREVADDHEPSLATGGGLEAALSSPLATGSFAGLDGRRGGGGGGGSGAASAPPSPSLACLSLQELGLSASGLAAIASGNGEPHTSRPEPTYADQNRPPSGNAEASTTPSHRSSGSVQKASGHRLDEGAVAAVTREEFDGLPLFLRSQVLLEELNVAVTRINDRVTDKRFGMMEVAPGTTSEHGSDADLISPADLHAIDLGPLMKAYLLLLVRLDRLLPEHHHGATCYRLCGG